MPASRTLTNLHPGFFSMTPLAQMMYIWRHYSSEELDTLMSWRPGVHQGVDVHLPRDVEYTLSLNLKFLFPIQERHQVAYDWFESLCRKARLSWIFRHRQRPEERIQGLPFTKNPNFDPELEDHWFALGIDAGRRQLQRSLDKPVPLLSLGATDMFRHVVLSPQELKGYLLRAGLLGFISDKNLGLVVTTRCWYEQQIQGFMDQPVFRTCQESVSDFFGRASAQLTLLTLNKGYLHAWLTPRVRKFINEGHGLRQVPVFHGIPKIHKSPWKIRPIVPMHSYMTSRVAITLHHLLLPVQRQFPWICESSRDLVKDVTEFNERNQQTRLHTGDVTSMYTAIPWRHFKPALQNLLDDYSIYPRELTDWIMDAADYVWHFTIFQCHNRLVEQVDGVPMGIACGPVFANLYMAFTERISLRGFDGLYRRYIDDIFVLHSSDEVVESLYFSPGMMITWAHSGIGMSFLDVWFHTHIDSPHVCFRPYEKVGNHHQYLPWASDHPLSVKKGLVKGELTRAAALSYKESYFVTWKATFLSRLRLRGWPVRALNAWGRQVHFRVLRQDDVTRLERHVATSQDKIIAISEYNPVWKKISSSDIWKTMLDEWARQGPQDQPFPPHCLVSKKRTRNLWDLIRSVNRNILKQEIEEITVEDVESELSDLEIDLPYVPL